MFSKIVKIEPFVTPHRDVLKAVDAGKVLQIDSGGGIRSKRQLVVDVGQKRSERRELPGAAQGIVDADETAVGIPSAELAVLGDEAHGLALLRRVRTPRLHRKEDKTFSDTHEYFFLAQVCLYYLKTHQPPATHLMMYP